MAAQAKTGEVAIIGGGIVGLALALELAEAGGDGDRFGTRSLWGGATGGGRVAWLAPEAEGLTGRFVDVGAAGPGWRTAGWIAHLMNRSDLPCGYWCCGIVAPKFAEETPGSLSRSELLPNRPVWGKASSAATWHPEDGQVNNRLLLAALHTAALRAGVKIQEGTTVYRWHRRGDRLTHLETNRGKLAAAVFVVAGGAHSRELVEVPIEPVKGQMLSVFDRDRRLQRVLFSSRAYLVPRQDGTIVVGATVERVGFLPGNTAGGLQQLLNGAIAVWPAIAELPIVETWWGFRPYAPQENPLLGRVPNLENLWLNVGHYRNGILLAPLCAQLLGRAIADGPTAEGDPLLIPFAPPPLAEPLS
ncbi:MAG: FAD-dependent oxidoreductase [Oscillatoriales cyanobacterium SM2_1_8]|nr:FAD-dependent oxidoreductase [Oscillatoriales cyanobacterium SM2_1_8]